MADGPDESQKTEPPTPKKLSKAAKEGDIPKSQEVSAWVVLFGGAIALAFTAKSSASALAATLSGIYRNAHEIHFDSGQGVQFVSQLGQEVTLAIIWPMSILVAAALAGNVLQHKPVLATAKLKPKLNRLSPIKGLNRMFSISSLMNLGKGFAKMAIVASVIAFIMYPELDRLRLIIRYDVNDIPPMILMLILKLLVGVLAVLAVLAILDLMYTRYSHEKRMKMTKQEVKDETRQAEGDPKVKQKIRQLRMERTRQRMIAAIPGASLILVNPTHYSVALKYEDGMAAPLCVAKGVDDLALKIREVAREHDIPIIRNPPLARALHDTVDVDEEIPSEHYKAVAEVISYVMGLRGKMRR